MPIGRQGEVPCRLPVILVGLSRGGPFAAVMGTRGPPKSTS
jgi:hypothetical protein